MSVLELAGIHRAFVEEQDVVRDVSLAVGPGEVVGLVGPNGAGKTTLLRIAMGMLRPRAGTVRLFGMDPWDEPVAVKRRVGYVSEDQVLPTTMSVKAILGLHRAVYPTWDETLAAELLDAQGLRPSAFVGTLSKGQARRVALVCALAHRPELLILDEPAGGLDPAARRDFLEAAIGSMSRDGCTVVFSSHHMPDVERIAGRVVLMQHGAVVLDGSLDDCREGFALVVGGPTLEPMVRATAGFVSLRRRGAALHALLKGTPSEVGARLDGADVEVRAVTLEDLFIELVEGNC